MRAVVLSGDSLLRDGIQCLLSGVPWCVSIEAFSDYAELAEHLRVHRVDVAIATLEQIEIGELAALEASKRANGFRVVAVGDSDSLPAPMGQLADQVVNRAGGFEALRAALRAVDNPRPARASLEVREPTAVYGVPRQLTPREREVARLVSQGLPNRRIAKVLGIQEQSVKNLVSVVMRKLDCENRVQVALHLSAPSH